MRRQIGIFGGTFNPPHVGHLAAALATVEHLQLNRLFYIPAGLPPHKPLPEDTPSNADRLEMVRLAADGVPGAEVLDLELHRDGPSYTADTLALLQRAHPDAALWLLIGADVFLTLQDWYQPTAILAQARIAAFIRDPCERERLTAQAHWLEKEYGARITFIPLEAVEISSTWLRDALAQGEGAAFLQPAVYGYILRRGLYGTRADLTRLSLDQLRAVARSFLKSKRVPHVLGTEEAAVRLAARWGAGEMELRVAALLHDCTKRLGLEEQLKLCEKYGIVLDDVEKCTPKLLHAKTGAALARAVFGVSDPVYNAIYWHTTGKRDMSLMEKVLYLADYIEPSRSFEGVDALRALAYQDLDAALLLGAEMTMREMTALGTPVHTKTTEMRDWLKGKGK